MHSHEHLLVSPMKLNSGPRLKLGGRTILTRKELRHNFSEIRGRVLEGKAFCHISNRLLDESVVVDENSWATVLAASRWALLQIFSSNFVAKILCLSLNEYNSRGI